MDAHESAAAKKAAAKQDAKKDASTLSVVEQELLREGALARMITLFQRERTESCNTLFERAQRIGVWKYF